MDTILSESVGFNPAPARKIHVDLNSCFASIEQQANPKLRGKPVVVAAYTSPGGCVLTASREAKVFGVDTGMRVSEARALIPGVIVISPDPWKYRFVNRKLLAIMQSYTSDVEVKSIDEMVLQIGEGKRVMSDVAKEIKERIKKEIGEWLTVSVGIAPNRYLAKIGAGLHKPDGLDEINGQNVEKIFADMSIEKLTGIKSGYGSRLRNVGIATALDFYRAPIVLLRYAFHSIVGYHWWMRLHGWEADDRQFDRKSFGQSHALYKPFYPSQPQLHQVLCQLVEKMGRRMRSAGYYANGIHVSCVFSDYSYWHTGKKLGETRYASIDLYKDAVEVLKDAPDKPVRLLAVSCHYLQKELYEQMPLYQDNTRKRALVAALDKISDRWGDFSVIPARMMKMEHKVLDRIAFGGIKGLEEFIFRERVTYEDSP